MTKDKLNFEEILKEEIRIKVNSVYSDALFTEKIGWYYTMFEEREACIKAMKQAVLTALPLILKHAAEKAKVEAYFKAFQPDTLRVDKQSILDCLPGIKKELGLS